MLIIVAILETAMRCDLHERAIDTNLVLFANKVCHECAMMFVQFFNVCVARVVCQVLRGDAANLSPRRMPNVTGTTE